MSGAGEHIWALVSGLPSERRGCRLFLMLKAYQAWIDASGKGDHEFLVLAGYLAPVEIWGKFSDEWKRHLGESGLSYFKMNEWAKKPEIAAFFYRVIEQFDVKAVSCLIRTKEIIEVVDKFPWPPFVSNTERLKNPYYFAFIALIRGLHSHQAKMKIDEKIDFFFDEEGEGAAMQDGWVRLKLSSSPQIRALMGDVPAYRNDLTHMPLQAADLYAWWVLKWAREGNAKAGVEKLNFDWKAKKDITRLHMEFPKEEFISYLQSAFTPEGLMRLFIDDPVAALKELEQHEAKK